MFKFLIKTFHKWYGWTVIGDFPTDIPKYVVIGGPHTTNWDFMKALFVIYDRNATITILGKKELFRPPFGWIFRALNVIPVERKKNMNAVDATVEIFKQHEKLVIGLSPEGTRSKTDRLRTGFYHIARKANVPLVMIGVNYANKSMEIKSPFLPSDDMEKDFEYIQKFYEQQTGLYPEDSFWYKKAIETSKK
ncbi:MAG: 1-acyl-sn-glycerol-3-phosphate acyltransferase [Saprospiraceae bacterium]